MASVVAIVFFTRSFPENALVRAKDERREGFRVVMAFVFMCVCEALRVVRVLVETVT